MASFVAHNLHTLRCAIVLGTHSVCQRDLDTMQKFGDYRKPWDRVVPIYHAMLSEGGRVMHRFSGFLGMVILLLGMVNHAHADTGLEDAATTRYAGPSLRPYVLPMHDLKPPVHSSSDRDLGLFTQTPAVSPAGRSSPLLGSSLRKRVPSVSEHNEPRASGDANPVPSKDRAGSNAGQIIIPAFPVLPEVSSPRMDHQDNGGSKRIVDYVIAGALIGGILFYLIMFLSGRPGIV